MRFLKVGRVVKALTGQAEVGSARQRVRSVVKVMTVTAMRVTVMTETLPSVAVRTMLMLMGLRGNVVPLSFFILFLFNFI